MTSHAFQTAGSVGAASTPTGASPNRPTIARPDVTADPRPVQQPVRGAGIALGLVVVIVLAEYVARRVVAPWLPIVGAPIVNDMLTMAVCYALLVAVAVGNAARTPVALGRALWAVVSRARGWLAWIGGVVFLTATLVVMQVDARVWGDVHLPVISIPPSTTVLFLGLATPLTTVSLLVVNGLVVPVAEERLWRGIIQPRLLVAWGSSPACWSRPCCSRSSTPSSTRRSGACWPCRSAVSRSASLPSGRAAMPTDAAAGRRRPCRTPSRTSPQHRSRLPPDWRSAHRCTRSSCQRC
jgi:membrane protease YdiL (CAAX protease family)